MGYLFIAEEFVLVLEVLVLLVQFVVLALILLEGLVVAPERLDDEVLLV